MSQSQIVHTWLFQINFWWLFVSPKPFTVGVSSRGSMLGVFSLGEPLGRWAGEDAAAGAGGRWPLLWLVVRCLDVFWSLVVQKNTGNEAKCFSVSFSKLSEGLRATKSKRKGQGYYGQVFLRFYQFHATMGSKTTSTAAVPISRPPQRPPAGLRRSNRPRSWKVCDKVCAKPTSQSNSCGRCSGFGLF